jgi:delta 1-pyrroline-5-carboxylate dehydrogenase
VVDFAFKPHLPIPTLIKEPQPRLISLIFPTINKSDLNSFTSTSRNKALLQSTPHNMAPSATTPPNDQTPVVTKTQAAAPKLDVWSNYTNSINGKQVTTSTTRTGINPATRENLPPVPVATKEDVEETVKAARAAFKSWKNVPVAERQAAVTAFADALEALKDDFAKLLTTEQGKPLALAEAEIGAGYIWMRELAKIDLKTEIVEETDTKQTVTRYTPLGVCVGIVPWNCKSNPPSVFDSMS